MSHHIKIHKENEMNRALSHLCAHILLNWARRTSWGWWDDWYDTVLQTQDSKFEASRSLRLPTILTFTRGWGRNILFVSFKPPRPRTELQTLAWKGAVLTTSLGPARPRFTRNHMRSNPAWWTYTETIFAILIWLYFFYFHSYIHFFELWTKSLLQHI